MCGWEICSACFGVKHNPSAGAFDICAAHIDMGNRKCLHSTSHYLPITRFEARELDDTIEGMDIVLARLLQE